MWSRSSALQVKPHSIWPGPALALPPLRLPCAEAGLGWTQGTQLSNTSWVDLHREYHIPPIIFIHPLLQLNFKRILFHPRCYSVRFLKPFFHRKYKGRLDIASSQTTPNSITGWGLTESDSALKSRAVCLKVPYTVAPKYYMLSPRVQNS